MGAMTLIVDRRATRLTLAPHNVLQLDYDDGAQQRVGLDALRCIVGHGDPQLSAALLRRCAERQIGVVLLPARGRGQPAWLLDTPNGSRLRLAQYRCHLDPEHRLQLARELVARKIEGQDRWLDAHGKPHLLHRFAVQARRAADIPALMGTEGAAAARYFHFWAVLWDPVWGFAGRNRRPPRDPINALLSLSYTLATGYVGRLAARHGLDTTLGYLHGPERDRPALALDLVEPLRPAIDQWLWQLIDDGLLTPDDFSHSDSDGCRLRGDARGRFFGAWYRDEDGWLRREARGVLALLLARLRPLR